MAPLNTLWKRPSATLIVTIVFAVFAHAWRPTTLANETEVSHLSTSGLLKPALLGRASTNNHTISHFPVVDYTNHSLIKIATRNIDRLLDELKNSTHDENHEILWQDGSSFNTSNSYVRLGPKATQRVKRDVRRNNAFFMTDNLQSWLNAERPHMRPQMAMPMPPPVYQNRRMPTRSIEDMMAEVAFEEDEVGTANYQPSASENMEHHQSKLVPGFILNRYHPLNIVNKFLDDVEKSAPGVTVFTIGHSHEKRPIRAIEILNSPSDPRFIWIDACTHAREWVTVTTALYMIEQIITTKLPLNFIIVPVLNVDGYVYTWTNDRMWRKNRRPYESSMFARHQVPDRCTGVDLNRNYDINFGGEGSSANPCSFLYQGPQAFSEPEVRAAAELLSKNRNRIAMTLSLHSFNQLWASPNAYTTARTKDHNHHMRVLKSVQNAVASVNGVNYEVGPLGAALYTGSGFMIDWIYHKLGIRDAYLVELRDKGLHGFVLPADQIWPTATETWAGLRAAINAIFQARL